MSNVCTHVCKRTSSDTHVCKHAKPLNLHVWKRACHCACTLANAQAVTRTFPNVRFTVARRHRRHQTQSPTRHTQPPCPSHSPAVCSRTGVEASGDEVGVEAPRRARPSSASHRLPLSPTRREEDRQDPHVADSMWSRITSVSRRGFTRIYEFLTGSRGSTAELTQSPDSGHARDSGGGDARDSVLMSLLVLLLGTAHVGNRGACRCL
jgi:hypothetical protein